MLITDTHSATPDEASYAFISEDGAPVDIRRNGWALVISTSLQAAPQGRTRIFVEEARLKPVGAVMTYTHATGKPLYATAIVIPPLGTWWISVEPHH